MKQPFCLIGRPWGVFRLKNKNTGEQTSLKTREKAEADNDAQSQSCIILAMARVYINEEESKLGTWIW